MPRRAERCVFKNLQDAIVATTTVNSETNATGQLSPLASTVPPPHYFLASTRPEVPADTDFLNANDQSPKCLPCCNNLVTTRRSTDRIFVIFEKNHQKNPKRTSWSSSGFNFRKLKNVTGQIRQPICIRRLHIKPYGAKSKYRLIAAQSIKSLIPVREQE